MEKRRIVDRRLKRGSNKIINKHPLEERIVKKTSHPVEARLLNLLNMLNEGDKLVRENTFKAFKNFLHYRETKAWLINNKDKVVQLLNSSPEFTKETIVAKILLIDNYHLFEMLPYLFEEYSNFYNKKRGIKVKELSLLAIKNLIRNPGFRNFAKENEALISEIIKKYYNFPSLEIRRVVLTLISIVGNHQQYLYYLCNDENLEEEALKVWKRIVGLEIEFWEKLDRSKILELLENNKYKRDETKEIVKRIRERLKKVKKS